MNEQLLLGTWLIYKTRWADGKETVYPADINWKRMTFEPGGIVISTGSQKSWEINEGIIYIHSFGKRFYTVERLTRDELELKYLTSDIHEYYKRL